jgi:hypothetical protein
MVRGGSEGGRPAHPAQLRALHLAMLDAVLVGEGLGAVAELAAVECGGPVALFVPRLEVVAGSAGLDPAQLGRLRAYALERCRGRVAQVPEAVAAEVPVRSGGELLGLVLLLGDVVVEEPVVERLRLVAVAALTELALAHAREDPIAGGAGVASLLADLAGGAPVAREEVVRRAARAGSDLRAGAVAVCCELHVERPHHVAALMRDEWPGALAEHLGGRLYALLPAGEADAPRARGLSERLVRHGPVGVSPPCADPEGLGRALVAAGLAVDFRPDGAAWALADADPAPVRAHYDATVAPLVRYDDVYDTDLVATLERVIDANGAADPVAAELGVPAHRVRYRLEKVRELSGWDPSIAADRRLLALGLRCWRVVAPGLPV